MREQTLSDALSMIYAAFDRDPPRGDSLAAIRARVMHIPDEAVPWIVRQLRTEERPPANMGLALVRGWEAWQLAHAERIIRRACPRNCDHGFRHCWRRDEHGRWRYFVALCPVCRPGAARETPGTEVMPDGFAGGALAFDRERRFGALWPLNTGAVPKDAASGTAFRPAFTAGSGQGE